MTNVFDSHVPPDAIAYCLRLWQDYKFVLRVVKPRQTRLGDFRVLPNRQMQITVNTNLNPYAFLITYVHEVAHADVYQQHNQPQRRRSTKPHGKTWQMAFQRLMHPLLSEAIFPTNVLHPLQQYMSKPAATTYANPALMQALRQFDQNADTQSVHKRILLRDVPEGKPFRLAQKVFIRGTLRRTRVVCKEMTSGKSYAVLAHAWVELDEE